MTTPPLRPHGVPSEYARLEALAVSTSESDGATSSEPSGRRSEPLVVVAEADPGLRAWVTLGLAEALTADAPALRIEAVATAERLVECLQREPVALVLCGHLDPPADWPTLLEHLRATSGGCVLVDHTGPGLSDTLNGRGQGVRLAEAVARLLQRTPGRSASDSVPPTVP